MENENVREPPFPPRNALSVTRFLSKISVLFGQTIFVDYFGALEAPFFKAKIIFAAAISDPVKITFSKLAI